MSKINLKNQEKVLNTLIDMYHNSPMSWIYHPVGFEQNFPFINAQDLIDILDILSDKGFITVRYGDLPDCFNIDMLTVNPSGLNYKPQKALQSKERWLERLFGFITGVLATVAADLLVRLITG